MKILVGPMSRLDTIAMYEVPVLDFLWWNQQPRLAFKWGNSGYDFTWWWMVSARFFWPRIHHLLSLLIRIGYWSDAHPQSDPTTTPNHWAEDDGNDIHGRKFPFRFCNIKDIKLITFCILKCRKLSSIIKYYMNMNLLFKSCHSK